MEFAGRIYISKEKRKKKTERKICVGNMVKKEMEKKGRKEEH